MEPPTVPYEKIRQGKDKGKYKSPTGLTWTLDQIAAYHIKKRDKKKK